MKKIIALVLALLTLTACGCGVVPTAWAQDGTVEGFEHERLPLFGVQWHPERILHGEDGCAPGLPLFRYFLCTSGILSVLSVKNVRPRYTP